MNEQHHTTAPAVAATFDPFAYAERLNDLKMLARSASFVVATSVSDAISKDKLVSITRHEADLICSLVAMVERDTEAAGAAFDLRAFAVTPTTAAVSAPAAKPVHPTMPDFETAFFDLEEPIHVVSRRLKVVDHIVETIDNRALFRDPTANAQLSPNELDALHSTMMDAVQSIDALSRRFFETYDAACAVEHAIRAAVKVEPSEEDKAIDEPSVPDPLLTMIVKLRALKSDGAFESETKARQSLERSESLWRDLAFRAPPARTAAGACAALNEALSDIEIGKGPLAPSLIRSALAYLGSAHVQ